MPGECYILTLPQLCDVGYFSFFTNIARTSNDVGRGVL